MSKSNVVKKANVVKQKKNFPWGKIFYYLKTLISNERVVDVGFHTKWYWSILVIIISIGLSIIPLAVNTASQRGSNYLQYSTQSNVYWDEPFRYGLQKFVEEGTADITFNTETNKASITGTFEGNAVYTYRRTINDGSATTSKLTLEICYASEDSYAATLENLRSYDIDGNARSSSFILFGETTFVSYAYSTGTTTSSSISGNYRNMRQLVGEGTTTISLKSFLSQVDTGSSVTSDSIFNNYKTLVDNFYIDNCNYLTGVYIGIIIAVNVAVVLIMWLVFFIMTRGKNNPLKPWKFYHFFGVASWASITPALLSLILGFMMVGYEIILFVLIYGFRAMWLSMRQLRSVVQ